MSVAALVMAHPGHELLVLGWVAGARPVVNILTDGSGLDGKPRIDSSETLLRALGARRGSVWASQTEREAYEALLGGHHDRFLSLAEALAESFVAEAVDLVVSDAAEGFHPVHDACRLVVDAAAEAASRRAQRPIALRAFAIYGEPLAPGEAEPEGSIVLDLDDDALRAKLAAASAYEGLSHEVDTFLARFGTDAFRRERLVPLAGGPGDSALRFSDPVYERYGEALRERGRVARVIRCGAHLAPLAVALRRWAQGF